MANETIVAVFNSMSEAETVAGELLDAGLNPAGIDHRSTSDTSVPIAGPLAAAADVPVQSGEAVLAVTSQPPSVQVTAIVEIMEQHDPIDINIVRPGHAA